MDFEPWFTPDDAALRFVFMERAFEAGELAVSNWRDPMSDVIFDMLDGAALPGRPKPSDDAVFRRHIEENRNLEIDRMQQAHRASYFIMAFAMCEASCTKFAELLLKRKRSPFHIRQISDNGLDRIKTIAGAYHIRVDALGGEQWKLVSGYRELRNCLVHSAGLLHADRIGSKLQALFENSEGIKLKSYGAAELSSIEMQDFFVRHVIAQLSEITSSVAASLFIGEQTKC